MLFYSPRELGVINGTPAHKGVPSQFPPQEFIVVFSRMSMDALPNVVSRSQPCPILPYPAILTYAKEEARCYPLQPQTAVYGVLGLKTFQYWSPPLVRTLSPFTKDNVPLPLR